MGIDAANAHRTESWSRQLLALPLPVSALEGVNFAAHIVQLVENQEILRLARARQRFALARFKKDGEFALAAQIGFEFSGEQRAGAVKFSANAPLRAQP